MGGSAKVADLTKRVEAMEKTLAKLDLEIRELQQKCEKTERDVKAISTILHDHEKTLQHHKSELVRVIDVLNMYLRIIQRLYGQDAPRRREYWSKYLKEDDD